MLGACSQGGAERGRESSGVAICLPREYAEEMPSRPRGLAACLGGGGGGFCTFLPAGIAVLLGLYWLFIVGGLLGPSDKDLSLGNAGLDDMISRYADVARNISARMQTAERAVSVLQQWQDAVQRRANLRVARMADALELARAELARLRSEPHVVEADDGDEDVTKVVCIETSRDGIDGWCPTAAHELTGIGKIGSAEECVQQARETPACLNRSAISFSRSGKCFCDAAEHCALGTHEPPDVDRYECTVPTKSKRLEDHHMQIGFNETTGHYRRWRLDFRCSTGVPQLPDGSVVECKPFGAPCCSNLGWCGATVQHCSCKTCQNFFQASGRLRRTSTGRECSKIGADLGVQSDVTACAEHALLHSKCGQHIMYSPSMNAKWGCKCCEGHGGNESGPTHPLWEIHEFTV